MLAASATLLLVAASAYAQTPMSLPQSPGAVLQGDGTVVSPHGVTLSSGQKLEYTARAGFLPLRRDDAAGNGEVLANMFFVAYTVDTPRNEARPLTFRWGGGPGSSSAMGQEGPRRARNGIVEGNPETWLDVTDIVMIDQVGTGYSRMTKPEYANLFFTPDGDAEAFVEAMRIYIRRYQTIDAPIFLHGSSYGSVRGVLVAEAAARRRIPIRGMILGAAFYDGLDVASDLSAISLLPSYTAAALYHGKLAPELMADPDETLGQAEAWAFGPYASALQKGNMLSPEERRSIAVEYARYSGLPVAVIEANNLRIQSQTFSNMLLRDQRMIIGAYDSRIAVPGDPQEFDPTKDPGIQIGVNAMPGPMERLYFARELGVNADLLGPVVDSTYLGAMGGGWPGVMIHTLPSAAAQTSEWMSMRWSAYGNPVPPDLLSRLYGVLRNNNTLNVLLINGKYDTITPYAQLVYARNRAPDDISSRLSVEKVDSGHALSATSIRDAVRSFYALESVASK
jgi:pimeloyl-ACP methyl ester carboxylesterase